LHILAELESAGVEFALLHGNDKGPPDVASDVDMAFALPPPVALEPILLRLARAGELAIVQRLHYDVLHGYYYILQIPGATLQFLHLDCLCDPLGVNRYRLRTTYLLEGATRGRYGKRIDKGKEAVYLLMKRAVKGRVTAQGLNVLRDRFRDASDSTWSDVRKAFGRRARRHVAELLRVDSAAEAGYWLHTLAAGADRRSRWGHPLLAVRSLLIQIGRKWRRLVQPTGLFVVVVGPDGSGKSTIATSVLLQLSRAFRATWRFHWRPGLLPQLSGSKSQPTSSVPAEISKYRGVVSLLRFIYYWLDFVVGYWLVIYLRKAQTTLVVGERYFPDVLVHPERYGFAVPKWTMRLAARCVPSPDLLIVLEDDPVAIFGRKGELSPAKIASQIEGYRDEAQHWRRSEVIHTGGGEAAVATRVCDMILSTCVLRTQARLAPDRRPQWRAFPGSTNVKVWCANDDTLDNALQLYPSYARSARLAKRISTMLPAAVEGLLLRGRPDPVLAGQLSALTDTIRRKFVDETLCVSFAAGTPGPHQKHTGQVTRAGQVIGYVKVARDDAVSALLHNEAEMLAWLPTTGFKAAELPAVLAFERDPTHTLLFISPPPTRPARHREHRADHKDAQFLRALGSINAGRMGVAEVMLQMQLDADLERTFALNLPALPIVRLAIQEIVRTLGAGGVAVSASHGDYAPWNTLELPDGRLFVIDWEYGKRRFPVLNDVFHRVFMPARLVSNERSREVIDRLLRLADDPVLRDVVADSGVSRTQLPAYVLLYLLGELARKPGLDEYMTDAIRYTLRCSGSAAYRTKALVAAYACEPGSGSEPGVGWNMCQAIGMEHEAWIITRENNRDKIERALAEHPNPNLHFRYADLPAWARTWKKGARGIHLYYYLWQFAAWCTARRLARDIDFDVAHHVTFVNDYTFSFLALMAIPFVWGPIGSNGRRPGALVEGRVGLLDEWVPYALKRLLRIVDPLFWYSALRARLVIGINSETARRFPLSVLAREKFVSHTAIGVEQALVQSVPHAVSDTLHVVSVGQLIPIKAFHLTVRAFARLLESVPQARLTIIGDGKLQSALQKLAGDLEVSARVEFIPWIPREQALILMRSADVFLFPSFEAAGMVVLEAMAFGTPVIALENTGPGEMITSECGCLVRAGELDETVERLAAALHRLAHDAPLRQTMGAAARRIVRERFLWEARHRTIRQWYAAAGIVLNPSQAKALDEIGESS
jgi:glycosyltransferase involved in cell wall biosynthesis/thymidylate kinase